MTGRMRTLTATYIVLGGLLILTGLAITATFGGSALFAILASSHEEGLELGAGLWLTGFLLGLFPILLGVPAFSAGIGLLLEARWGRRLAWILSLFSLPILPIGTALGILGLCALRQAPRS